MNKIVEALRELMSLEEDGRRHPEHLGSANFLFRQRIAVDAARAALAAHDAQPAAEPVPAGPDDMAIYKAIADNWAQPAAEPVAWQYRWTNPGNQPDQNPEWKPVEPIFNQTMQEKITELESFRYGGKPCYEVRALVVAPKETP